LFIVPFFIKNVLQTTIYRLSEEILLQKRNDFAQKNPNVYTSMTGEIIGEGSTLIS